MLRARTAGQANTLRLSPLLQRALARRARQTRTRLLGVAPSRIALAAQATQESVVAHAHSVRQARLRVILEIVLAVTAKAVSSYPRKVQMVPFGAELVHRTRIHYQVVITRMTVCARLDISKTQIHASNVRQENSKSRWAIRRARTAGQAHTLRQSQLLPTAHARHALPIQMRQPGVMLSRIAAAIPATPESMVANAQSAWQASIRMFLDLVPVVSA
jgi:hypothetical protein